MAPSKNQPSGTARISPQYTINQGMFVSFFPDCNSACISLLFDFYSVLFLKLYLSMLYVASKNNLEPSYGHSSLGFATSKPLNSSMNINSLFYIILSQFSSPIIWNRFSPELSIYRKCSICSRLDLTSRTRGEWGVLRWWAHSSFQVRLQTTLFTTYQWSY